MKELLLKAAVSGGIAAVGSNILYGDGDVNLLGMAMRGSVATGLAVGAGSIASDFVSDNIIENMNIPTNIKSIEEHLVRGAVCGAASSGVMLVGGMPSSNLTQSFLLGAGSKLGGDIAYDKVFGDKGFIGPIF